MSEIDWDDIIKWDHQYIVHSLLSAEEYSTTPVARTEGNYVILPDGTRLLDFYNQLFCVNAGQTNKYINDKIKAALERYGFLMESYTSDYKAKAAKMIVGDILGPDKWAKKIRFANTGSEAVEIACLFARLFTGRPLVVGREYAYHGITSGASSLSGLRSMKSLLATDKAGYSRSVPGQSVVPVIVAPAPYCYRCSLGHEYPQCKGKNNKLPCILATERVIQNRGVDKVAAIITEIYYGTATIHPPEEYHRQLRQLTRDLGIVWIVDEVMTGFGRTGKWFAYQHHDVVPDIMTVGKGISSSALPASAVIINHEIADFLDQHRWTQVSTFSGHPVSMAAVVANLEYMIENNLPEKAYQAGLYMGGKLSELEEKHKSVGLVKGSGQFWQVELVKNKETREPFIVVDRNNDFSGDLSQWPTSIVEAKAAEKGVVLGGFQPNTLRMGASLEVTKDEIDQMIEALDYALDYLDSLI